jgi:Ca2+-binding EF-hand superfamily protein
MSREECRKIISEVDLSQDSKISFDEFKSMMLPKNPSSFK